MMRSYMKTLIQQSLALAGFELRRKEKSAFEVQRALCPQLRPVIFDVGANWGETVAEYRRLFPEAKIYAFEHMSHFLRLLFLRMVTFSYRNWPYPIIPVKDYYFQIMYPPRILY